ncbi:hypothetical protein K8Z61_15800 [Nocardioides sp. TRM66260-LWL]|uniref:hypothetical protein n=1 Tax=Nocardioides sp. TRM66260-LWL TaxID=2874478 RepID=UPI001CC3A064|nr:hypothetical protein [Nocardioides sp. TRM66260-LWL]MBZ5735957.1 hypothetical protein [Nocardioides sp. TRM66260-LWL]
MITRTLPALALLLPALALPSASTPADAAVAADASATPRSSATSSPRPGPALLYAKPVVAPQLQNRGEWEADPILISGAEAYRDGEWLYQDWLQDDHGARGVPDPTSPYDTVSHTFSPAFGSYTYPTDPACAGNGADLVEYRIRPTARSTDLRVTLNTLRAPERTAFTVAFGGTPGTQVAWPHGAGVSSPASLFLTWHGRTAELRDADGTELTPRPTVGVDLARNQVTVRIPRAAWDPARRVVRTTIGVGLWDTAADRYLAPAPTPATATTPGGGSPVGAALVNVGPRPDEPLPLIAGATIVDTAAGAAATSAFWRERQQALQLALGDVSPFSAEVDFGRLRDRVRDDRRVPRTGPMDRILSSRFGFGEGLDPSTVCFSLAGGALAVGAAAPAKDCRGSVVGRLQSYGLYVPTGRRPKAGWGLTIMPHSLSANYNQYLGTRNQRQLGERDGGSIVVTPGGRGPDGFSAGAAEADLFETWADVRRHHRLDPRWTAMTGYSMGGFSTYRMLARWPDLFGRGFSVVGAPGSVGDQLASLRNNPIMAWNAGADELVNLRTQRDAVAGLQAAGVRFEQWTFPAADHLTLAANDEYGPGVAFLGRHLVPKDPKHVTYVVDPSEDTRFGDIRADHAWWLSGLRTADGTRPGTVDARSLATTAGDPPVVAAIPGAGVLVGGQEPLPYVTEGQRFGAAPRVVARDALVLTLTNLRAAVVDVRRAGLTCDAAVRATSDVEAVVELAGCGRTLRIPATPAR